jgi:hypothetical protein
LDFFDDEEEPQTAEPRRPARRSASARPIASPSGGAGGRPPSDQQIRTRRLALLGGGIIVFILLVLAVRGCLDARKERAFQNYVRDLSALTAETDQLSDNFFSAFEGSNESEISLSSQINGDRGTAQSLLERASNLDAPDELKGPQSEIALAYQLRSDALAAFAEQLPQAIGRNGSNRAIRNITQQMQVFLASDVLYLRAQQQIEGVISDEGIAVPDGVPDSNFLPPREVPGILDRGAVEAAISGSGGGGGGSSPQNCPDEIPEGEIHGLGLVSTTLVPDGITLEPGTTVTAPAQGAEFEVSVQNQGTEDESDITVSLSGDLSGSQTISSIAAGETETVTVPPRPSPSAGDSASVTVEVEPVCGEQEETNNEATYELTFE